MCVRKAEAGYAARVSSVQRCLQSNRQFNSPRQISSPARTQHAGCRDGAVCRVYVLQYGVLVLVLLKLPPMSTFWVSLPFFGVGFRPSRQVGGGALPGTQMALSKRLMSLEECPMSERGPFFSGWGLHLPWRTGCLQRVVWHLIFTCIPTRALPLHPAEFLALCRRPVPKVQEGCAGGQGGKLTAQSTFYPDFALIALLKRYSHAPASD